jgi:hypothetical protein
VHPLKPLASRARRPLLGSLDGRLESLIAVGECCLDGGVQDRFHERLGQVGGAQPVRGLDGLAVDACRQKDRWQLRMPVAARNRWRSSSPSMDGMATSRTATWGGPHSSTAARASGPDDAPRTWWPRARIWVQIRWRMSALSSTTRSWGITSLPCRRRGSLGMSTRSRPSFSPAQMTGQPGAVQRHYRQLAKLS